MCPDDKVLKIYRAQYGRFVSGEESCPHKSVRYLTSFDCVSDVTEYTETRCDDKQSCTVKATNRNLGDPCTGIFKHLDIKFYCASPAPASTSPPMTMTTSDQASSRNSLSKEVMKCTKLYTSILDSAPHMECDALQAYKDCLLRVEVQDPSSVADIDRVMPTLDSNLQNCFRANRPPTILLCKHTKLKGDCVNVTSETPDLQEFDNTVRSIKVYAGNWALYSGLGYTGTEDRVKPGFHSNWLGVYAPVEGDPISLYAKDLSSLRPVEDIQYQEYEEYTDTTFSPTSDYTEMSTPDFSGISLSYSEPARPSITTESGAYTDQGYSQWVNLDDISSSKHPDMCRTTYCLLGIRVIYSELRAVTLPTRQTVEDMILQKLMDTYNIYAEQLVLAEVAERSSEIILEIIDMKVAPKRVVDIAIEIEEDIKHEEFTFTLGDTMMIPTSDRYGVMLKTISESYLPKRVQIVTEATEPDSPTTPGILDITTSSPVETPDNNVETEDQQWTTADIPYSSPGSNGFDNNVQQVMDNVKHAIEDSEENRKFFYPLLITALLIFVLACVIISTVVYKCTQNTDYTLIKKASSNIYVDVDTSTPVKTIEGFENPSYLLEEVDHM